MIPTRRPGAELGRYAVDMSSPILKGTWQAARAAVDCALTGASLIEAGERAAFALCRPPGHHAGRDYFGGYCFLNNAAIAAQWFRDAGAARVAVLDVDYHHGNGTQDIFYDRGDVLTAVDPCRSGAGIPLLHRFRRRDRHRRGAGRQPEPALPWGSDFTAWGAAMDRALAALRAFAPDRLVVSLGVDAFDGDPISRFRLQGADFLEIGRRIGRLGLPTLFVMEGGYAVAAIGDNVVNVLRGFQAP
jgi:acetoin utilization deacetylase AcuC-like enzyme